MEPPAKKAKRSMSSPVESLSYAPKVLYMATAFTHSVQLVAESLKHETVFTTETGRISDLKGYGGESVLLIKNAVPNQPDFVASNVKRYASQEPFLAPIHPGTRKKSLIRPKFIICMGRQRAQRNLNILQPEILPYGWSKSIKEAIAIYHDTPDISAESFKKQYVKRMGIKWIWRWAATEIKSKLKASKCVGCDLCHCIKLPERRVCGRPGEYTCYYMCEGCGYLRFENKLSAENVKSCPCGSGALLKVNDREVSKLENRRRPYYVCRNPQCEKCLRFFEWAVPPFYSAATGDSDFRRPSEAYDVYWIFQHPSKPVLSPTYGKWLVFQPVSEIDNAWEDIRKMVASDMLGATAAKTATMRENPHSTDENYKVMCVYTTQEDIEVVGMKLMSIVKNTIRYKTDQTTMSGKYSSGGMKTTCKTLLWNGGQPCFE